MGSKDIVFFDGICHLCNGFVDFVISRDKQRQFLFASLQGETAKNYLSSQYRLSLETVVIYLGIASDQRILKKSDAVLYCFSKLGFPYMVFGVFRYVPVVVRDLIYDYVARNRYRFFGKRETCRIPSASEKDQLYW